jgi:hypothetical protein
MRPRPERSLAGSLLPVLVRILEKAGADQLQGVLPAVVKADRRAELRLIAGLIVWLNRGGSAVIKHYTLRLTLWLSGYTPFKFIKFLDHCAKLILLKKVGGYIFVHRMLLDYFAELPTQAASNKSASDTSDPG